MRRYRRAGYRLVPGEGTFPGTADLTKRPTVLIPHAAQITASPPRGGDPPIEGGGPVLALRQGRSEAARSAGSSRARRMSRSATTAVVVWAAMMPMRTRTWAAAAWAGDPPPSSTPMNAPGG